MDAILLTQLAANGISVGIGYALAAVGLALVFGILEQVNFAHGELYMLGAFVLYALAQSLSLPYGAALPLTVLVMAAAGYALAELAFIPTLDRPFEAVILATFALSIVLQNGVRLIFGASPREIATPLKDYTFELGGVLLFGQRLLIIGAAAAAFAALIAFLRRTETGRAMRAVAQNKQAAVMVGINILRIISGSMDQQYTFRFGIFHRFIHP